MRLACLEVMRDRLDVLIPALIPFGNSVLQTAQSLRIGLAQITLQEIGKQLVVTVAFV